MAKEKKEIGRPKSLDPKDTVTVGVELSKIEILGGYNKTQEFCKLKIDEECQKLQK